MTTHAAAVVVGVLAGVWLSRRREVRRKRTLLVAQVRPDRKELYKRHHSGVWPEIEAGLAAAGVETISIWSDPSDECKLFLYCEQAEDALPTGPGSAYRANDTVRKWEETMETEFHSGWTPCNEWYTLKSCASRRVQLSTNSLPPCYEIMCTECINDCAKK